MTEAHPAHSTGGASREGGGDPASVGEQNRFLD
jgi:hypothetical protein